MKEYIESFKDFPKKGIMFWDFTPLLENPKVFKEKIKEIANHFKGRFNKIAAIEAKGFTIGSVLAYETKKPLFLIRKPNLIPGEVISEKFEKEYGLGEYQIKKGVLTSSDKILIIYDILAGPGAARAAINLVEKEGAKVAGCAFVIELEYLKGREKLEGYDVFSLIKIKEKNEVQNNKF